MKRTYAILGTGLMVIALSVPSWAQTRIVPTQTVTIAGTIETVADSRHTVNIRKLDGNKASTDGSFTIAQTNGQDRRDTRQDCRQAEGAVGKDKRDCKQGS